MNGWLTSIGIGLAIALAWVFVILLIRCTLPILEGR